MRLMAMENRKIGGLSVPVVGLGCNQFGTATCDEASSIGIINEALDAGITYFDIADEYGQNYFDRSATGGWGGSEEILGRALKGRRDEVIIATKFGSHPNGETERGGNSARWARIAIEDSLRRLQTDHIDLYQVHFPDPGVPIAETLSALDEMVRAGKVREIGCSNFTAEMMTEAAQTASQDGFRRFVSAQNPLNLFQRGAVDDLLPVCEQLEIAFIPYYPLASGMLTGKYRRGSELPSSTRLTDGVAVGAEARERLFSDKTFARLEALDEFATSRGHTLLELAFAWLLAQPAVATVIAGAARAGQASSNARAADWRLSREEAAEATRVLIEAA
jgi:aryl-alcohol dehydrogenase-like predicted oxidoreductase